MLKILDGKIIRDEIIVKLKKEIEAFETKPTLAIIQVGDLEESNKYIKAKKNFALKIGAEVKHLKFSEDISQEKLQSEIERLNIDKSFQGIIVQLPISKNLNEVEIIESINPKKDVDGLTSQTRFVPATAKGIMNLLDYYKIDLTGKKVTMMGRSRLVGQPTVKELLKRQALVSIVHSQTPNAKEITKSADILIVAIGKPKLVDDSYVVPGQVIIDVGINYENSTLKEEIELGKKKLVGDVNFDKVKDIVLAITPVPGGVGAMTVASLFVNLVEAYRNVL